LNELIRICRICAEVKEYKNKQTYRDAEKRDSLCKRCGYERGIKRENELINKFILILRSKGLSEIEKQDQKIINNLINKTKDN